MNNKQLIGKKGESLAVKYLENLGYKIIKKNFRCKMGEIDIIAQDRDFLIFVEVKTRSNLLWGNPAESIGTKKLSSIIKTLQFYLLINNKSDKSVRVDAIEIYTSNNESKINHIKNITF
ncbi:MAG: YraN family protein [Candidatus Levybacteria bacterium RIFCSPLOWO2_01_FULL_36_10]|nr:MAG: YraN family protein [Candidatus Levybacteria bacterium RIFCSPLOWO2_01_FULL_36_10]